MMLLLYCSSNSKKHQQADCIPKLLSQHNTRAYQHAGVMSLTGRSTSVHVLHKDSCCCVCLSCQVCCTATCRRSKELGLHCDSIYPPKQLCCNNYLHSYAVTTTCTAMLQTQSALACQLFDKPANAAQSWAHGWHDVSTSTPITSNL